MQLFSYLLIHCLVFLGQGKAIDAYFVSVRACFASVRGCLFHILVLITLPFDLALLIDP